MIKLCRTSKSSNRRAILGVLIFFLPLGAHAQFKSGRDRLIIHDILGTFAKECIEKASADAEVLSRLDGEVKEAQHSKNQDVQKCYESNFSQIAGVHYLYQKICDDVSHDKGTLPDSLAARQLLEVNKYQSGIRPYHSILNDCLVSVENHAGLPYVVPLSGLDLNAKTIVQEIEGIRIKDPFPATLVPLR